MPADARRIYLDANVPLAFVKGEADRADVVQALLDEGRRRVVELVTSVWSITEVAHGAMPGRRRWDPGVEAAIDNLWVPASPITLVDISEVVCREARSVVRRARQTRGKGIKPADALHLASAVLAGCDVIYTYEADQTRQRWSSITGIAVESPSVEQPQLDLSTIQQPDQAAAASP
jgi:predicted nucleic acid-binding protein